jgi:hypothetical protein
MEKETTTLLPSQNKKKRRRKVKWPFSKEKIGEYH